MTTDETQVQPAPPGLRHADPRLQPLPPGHPGESALERHVRHIHNWVMFWSILQLVVLVTGMFIGILVMAHIHAVNVQNSSPVCQSLGGTDPSC